MAEATSAFAAPRDWRLVALIGVRLLCRRCLPADPQRRPGSGSSPRWPCSRHARSACRAQRLRTHNRRMRVALDNMSQGLCMFDRNERLVVCNQRYKEMYHLPDDVARPGMTLTGLLEYRASHRHLLAQGRGLPARAARLHGRRPDPQHRSQIRRRPCHLRSPTGRWPTAAGSRRMRTSPSGATPSASAPRCRNSRQRRAVIEQAIASFRQRVEDTAAHGRPKAP